VSHGSPRGGQFVSKGEDVINDWIDKRRAGSTEPSEDWSSHSGALRLARRIEEFWGGQVACSVEKMSFTRERPQVAGGYYAIRSNLVYVMPKRAS